MLLDSQGLAGAHLAAGLEGEAWTAALASPIDPHSGRSSVCSVQSRWRQVFPVTFEPVAMRPYKTNFGLECTAYYSSDANVKLEMT
jgi:hypothetical protein